jgi:hypothetical protein
MCFPSGSASPSTQAVTVDGRTSSLTANADWLESGD